MAFRKMRNTVEDDQPAETEVEAEIREFVRRDVVTNRERQPENESEMVASSINSVLQRATTRFETPVSRIVRNSPGRGQATKPPPEYPASVVPFRSGVLIRHPRPCRNVSSAATL